MDKLIYASMSKDFKRVYNPERQNMTKPEVTQEADSGFTQENIADAEWFWTMLPVFTKWGSLKTYEKAAAIHAVQRFRIAAEQRGMERERERCLREAERPVMFDYVREHDGQFVAGSPYDRGREVEAKRIAQAIRQGEQA